MNMIPYMEYLNVRIKGFQSCLFDMDIYDNLLTSDNLGTLTTFLLDQAIYRDDIEAALEESPEREGLERGVTNHFARNISHIYNMSSGKARYLFELALVSFDLTNIKALVLAKKRNLPFHTFRDMIIPCGSINYEDLLAMFSIPEIEDVIPTLSRLSTLGAESLMDALSKTSEKDSSVLFVNHLEKSFYKRTLKLFQKNNDEMKILRDILRFEIDLKNLKTALKLVWEGADLMLNDSEFYIPGGIINSLYLEKISGAKTLDEAFEMVETTPFSPAVEKGIIYFAETGFLHEMERFFEEVFIRRALSYRRFNPFGIGVFMGYVWAQFAELTNLRTIINGIAFKFEPGQIRKGLILV